MGKNYKCMMKWTGSESSKTVAWYVEHVKISFNN